MHEIGKQGGTTARKKGGKGPIAALTRNKRTQLASRTGLTRWAKAKKKNKRTKVRGYTSSWGGVMAERLISGVSGSPSAPLLSSIRVLRGILRGAGNYSRSLGFRIPTRLRRLRCGVEGRGAWFRRSRGRFRGRIGLRRSVPVRRKPLPGCELSCRCVRT